MKKINQMIIIDDSKMDCFINETISSRAFEKVKIKSFNSSKVALDYFKNPTSEHAAFPANNVDIILMDINMPLMNGFDLLKKLEKTNQFSKNKTQVYFLSSSNFGKDINEALSIKACSGYIMKPLTKEKLVNAMIIHEENQYFLLNKSTPFRSKFSNDVA